MDVLSTIGNALTGTSSDAGLLGVGQYKASGVDVDKSAFGDKESEARQREFAKQLAASQQKQAPTMMTARLGPAATVGAQQAGPAQIGAAQTRQAAQIATGPQDQFRNQQMALANQLAAQAQGQGPSLAQAQLRQATDRNIAQQAALIGSQRGLNPNQAARQAAIQGAAANQQAAGQSAQLRLQEQQAAQQALAGIAGAGREQDLGLAQNQASLNQQATLSNRDAVNQFALQQAALNQQAGLANAQMGMQAGLANQDAANQFALAQAQLKQQAAANNQQATLQQSGLNNQMSQYYNTGLMNMEQADRDAQMALQQLLVNQNTGLAGVNQAGYASASKARGDLVGNLGSGLAALAMAKGGVVPGKAKHKGDDLRNDTVPVMLSPGEIVVPRTIADDDKRTIAFVQALSKGGKVKNYGGSDKKLAEALSKTRRAC